MALIKKVKFEVTVECWERDADLVEEKQFEIMLRDRFKGSELRIVKAERLPD